MLDALRQHGALFRPDLGTMTGRLPSEVEEALWDGVARGLVTADGFRAVRSLLRRSPRLPAARDCADCAVAGAARRPGRPGAGRCFPSPPLDADRDELAEAVAEQLAARWGVVFHDLVARENLAVPWREVLWAFRRMEARGTIRGGRFVAGFSGEQFAHPDALDVLRAVRKRASPASPSDLRRRPAEPDQHRAARAADPRHPGQHRHLRRRRGRLGHHRRSRPRRVLKRSAP